MFQDEETLEQKVARLERSEAKLREQQEMYIQILDSIMDMILVKDETSHILYANRRFRDFYGMTLEQLQGIIDAPFNKSEYTEQYLVDDAYVISTGNVLNIPEEPVTRHDGVVRYFHTIKSPLSTSAEGRSSVGVSRDITEQKFAEEERRRTERALDEAERLFRQMAESMRDVFFVAEPHFERYIYVSPAYERTWGRPCKELLTDPSSMINAILTDDRVTFLKKMEEAFPGGEFSHEFRIKRHDEIRWIWCRTFPVVDDDGHLQRICGIAHDITERKEVERRVSEFNSMVSHELRTPLTSIRAALGLIEGGQTEPIGEGTMELISIARDECDRLVRLINDLLDIKKIEANKIQLKMEELQPDDIVNSVMSTIRGFAQESKIRIVPKEIRAEKFIGDRDRIIQVLTNLVSNAVKFSPPQSEVVISTELVGNSQIKFSVEDHGPGIPEVSRANLFTAFHQVDSSDSRAKGGTGLGLAICKGIVERHGGSIGFESANEGGSVFWFELPLKRKQAIGEIKNVRS